MRSESRVRLYMRLLVALRRSAVRLGMTGVVGIREAQLEVIEWMLEERADPESFALIEQIEKSNCEQPA